MGTSIKLGIICKLLVSLLMLVILIPLELVESLLVKLCVLEQVLGLNITLTELVLSLPSTLSNKNFILTVQSKLVSPFMLISCLINQVSIFTIVVPSKVDMLSKLSVGVPLVLKIIGSL